MKTRFLCFAALLAVAVSFPNAAFAQLSTSVPTVTAESESWYASGAPINLGGILYYPSGPVTHFSRNEMVFTGFFERIPVYKRTTQEPGSILYVPLAGGLVRPYERRRSGDLAGTVGSTSPSFPVVLPAADSMQPAAGPAFFGSSTSVIPRPVGTTGFVYGTMEPQLQPVGTAGASVPAAVETAGFMVGGDPLVMPIRRGPARVETVRQPVGLNAMFIEFRESRWYPAGPAVELALDRFTRLGDYHGFDVYQAAGQKDTVYVSTIVSNSTLWVPYRAR